MKAPRYVKVIGDSAERINEGDEFVAVVVATGQVDGLTLVEGVHTGDRFHVDPADLVEHEGMWL